MPRRRIIFAALSLAITIDPAIGQEGEQRLAAGSKALAAGQYSSAVTQLTAALGDASLAADDAAQALYRRGIAQRRLGQQAKAIADLSQAIWLGKLSKTDQVRALVERGQAYRATGLETQSSADFAAARKLDAGEAERLLAAGTRSPKPTARAAEPAQRPQAAKAPQPAQPGKPEPPRQLQPKQAETPDAADLPAAWQTQDAIAAERESQEGNRVSRFFGNMADRVLWWRSDDEEAPAEEQGARPDNAEWAAAIDGQNPAPAKIRPAPAPEGKVAAARPKPQPAAPVGAPKAISPPKAAAPAAEPARQARAEPSANSGYMLQVASARSEEAARAEWAKLSAANKSLVAGREPQFIVSKLGDLGTFYRVHIGPFKNRAESAKLCDAFKNKGVDCFLVTK